MRILYLTAFYPPDFASGATLAVQRLAERAAAAGHDVHVFSGAIHRGMADGAVESSEHGGVTVHWIGSASWTDPRHDVNWTNPVATAAVARLLDELAPDVVHAHTLQTLGAGPVAEALDRGVRSIVTMHDMWWWCALLFLVNRDLQPCTLVTDAGNCPCARDAPWRTTRAAALRTVLERVHEVLVPSEIMRDVVIANGVDRDRVTVDPNDVDTGDLRPASPSGRHGEVRFLFIGGDHPLKGTDVLVAAATRLRHVGGWTLTLYGVEHRPELAGLPVTTAAAFAPEQRADVLGGGDVLVIASIARESFSLAAREGLSAGLAVVTTDCFGPEEVVRHGVNGLVVRAGDAVDLAEAMHSLIEEPTLLGTVLDGAHASTIEWRTADEHAASLLARYDAPLPQPAASAVGTVSYVTQPGTRHGRVRADHGAEALNMHGVRATIVDAGELGAASAVAGSDAVVLQDLASSPSLLKAVESIRRAGTVVLYDTSDTGFDTATPHHGDTAGRRELMARCDAIIAPTNAVARRAEELTGRPALVVGNSVGIEEIRIADRVRSLRRRRLFTRGPTLVAVVHPFTALDWAAVEPHVAALLLRHRRWRLQILGDIGDHRGLDRLGRRVRHETLHDWHSLPARLAGADAVLAPFTTVAPGHDAATIATWLDASLVGVPVVTVAAGEVAGVIHHGVTGLIAATDDEWMTHVESLVDDPAAAARIAAAAHRQVLLHHGPHSTAHRLVDAFSIARTWRHGKP